MERQRIGCALLVILLCVSMIVVLWPQPPPPPPPPEADGVFLAFDEFTARPAALTVMCDIYVTNDEIEFILKESVLNNRSIAAQYYTGEHVWLHVWDPTDNRLCEQFSLFTVPGHTPYAELFDIRVNVVRQPTTWDIAAQEYQNITNGYGTRFTFVVCNQEDDTGYKSSFDFLEKRERSALFFVTFNTTLAYCYASMWDVFETANSMTFMYEVSDDCLSRDLLADGSRAPSGLLATYFDVWFIAAGTYEMEYGLVLSTDKHYFISMGTWGDATLLSVSSIITVLP